MKPRRATDGPETSAAARCRPNHHRHPTRRLGVILVAMAVMAVLSSCRSDVAAPDPVRGASGPDDGGVSSPDSQGGDRGSRPDERSAEAPSPVTTPTAAVGATPPAGAGSADTPTPLATPTRSTAPAPTNRPSRPLPTATPLRPPTPTSVVVHPVAPVGTARLTVTRRVGHEPSAFTQGFEFHDGRLYESRGLEGESALTEIDPDSGDVLRVQPLPVDVFGEGLTVVDDTIIVLTWRSERAFVFALEDFAPLGEIAYEGEGWGLCDDGDRLVMSDGSAELTFRDRADFDEIGSVTVRRDGRRVEDLNELECVGDLVWANVWLTDEIVVIDPATGAVRTTIDASGLLAPAEQADADVLNGIAVDDRTGELWVTGKWWPWMFVVEPEA